MCIQIEERDEVVDAGDVESSVELENDPLNHVAAALSLLEGHGGVVVFYSWLC